MKKLLTIIASCIVVCILLSSCGSNISIAKRHYTKGYYVEYTKRIQTATPQKVEPKIVQNKKILPVHSIQYISKEESPDKNINEGVTNKTTSTPTIAVNEKLTPKVIPRSSYNSQLTKNVTITESPILQTNQVFSDVSGHYGDGGGGRAALSLLWIIIIVILILWLIGILAGGFGLGGLINVLLIIALILLILWLLRIA